MLLLQRTWNPSTPHFVSVSCSGTITKGKLMVTLPHSTGEQRSPPWPSATAMNTGCNNKADKAEEKRNNKTGAIGALDSVWRPITVAVATVRW